MPRGRELLSTAEIEAYSLESAASDFYKNNKVKKLADASQKTYKIYVDCFIRWMGKHQSVTEITETKLEDYILYLSDEKDNKPVSIATNMRHIRRFIKFCISRGYLGEIEVIVPKYDEVLKEPYSDEEMKLLLARPKTHNWVEFRDWTMVNYFFSTGQRLSTALNIKVEDIDFLQKTVLLRWNKDKIQKRMPLSTALCDILKEYIERSALEVDNYLFIEYEGKKFTTRGAESAIKRYNESRGVAKTSIHAFRHSFARGYIINGGNPMVLQKLLNHKSLLQTMKYVNLYGNDVAKDLDLFNPLDSFKRQNNASVKRRYTVGDLNHER